MGNSEGTSYGHIQGENKIQFQDRQSCHAEFDDRFVTDLFSNTWHIGFKNYTDKHWRNIFQFIKSCTTTELSLKNVNAPEVLTKIIHIEFTNLLSLKLNNICLLSIQPLIHLQAAKLEILELSLNHFSNLRSLRKMNFPKLKRFQIYEQAFLSADFFFECNFHKQMTSIVIFNAKTKTLPQNYNWMFKIQAKSLEQFEYYNTQIIRNTAYNNMAKQKYPMAKIKLRYDTL